MSNEDVMGHYEGLRNLLNYCPAQKKKFTEAYCRLQPEGINLECKYQLEKTIEVIEKVDGKLRAVYYRKCSYIVND